MLKSYPDIDTQFIHWLILYFFPFSNAKIQLHILGKTYREIKSDGIFSVQKNLTEQNIDCIGEVQSDMTIDFYVI